MVYREEDFEFDPDSGYNANQRYPDVVQNIILPVTVDGTTNVTEFFAEFAIPLVSDRKLVQSFELNPGWRYSDYDTVGAVDTYKLTADWAVNDRVRVRGGHQFANRAPNVTELFTPRGGSQLLGGNDACAYYPVQTQSWGNRPENPNRQNLQILCQHLMVRDGAPPTFYQPGTDSSPGVVGANDYAYNVFGAPNFFPFVIGVTEGNRDLDSESANTTTAGVVLSPIDGLTLSIDWYEIKLNSAIGIPGHDVVYQQCLDARFNPLIGDAPGSHSGAELAAANPFCALIQREYLGGAPLAPGNFGADRRYDAQYINQGGIHTEGIDLQVDWGIGNFNVNFVANYLDHIQVAPFPGAAFIDYTGTTNNGVTSNSAFDYRTFSTVGYNAARFSVGVRWQHQPALDPAPGSAANVLGVDSHDQFDLFATWRPTDRLTLRSGIDNLTNEDPEWVNVTTVNNNIGATNSDYDQIGRRYFFGLTLAL
jgi:outer membrane receptor protein involved in Fe transport